MKVPRRFSWLLVVLMGLVLVGAAQAQGKSAEATSFGENEALNAAQEWANLVSQANVPELEKLLSDRYLHIHATALVESKAQFLEAFKSGTRKYSPIKLEETSARVFGNFAVVTGKFQLKVFSRGREIEGVNRFGLVLAKTPKGIDVVSFQATPIPQPK